MTINPSSGLIGRAPGGRKLVAIVHIDMVGYSRLIGLDDSGTLSRLRTLRQHLIDPAVDEHGGTIVQTAGDALLISFDSIDGAVRCAVKVQQQVPAYDHDQPLDRRIRFRIGIGIADVIADGAHLHGDGVNIAVRLEAEAPSGGICVSRAIRDHVHDRLDLVFEERGPLALKNIARPVEAFVLRLGPDTAQPKPPTPGAGAPGIPLPDKPSIAVLPFTNMSDDPEQAYFSDGIVDDIITGLSRNQAFFVIARNSSFTYKGRAVDIRQVGRELGVRYVLEGSVRKAGNRVRITGQLIEAATGNHIWADRFDGALDDIFALQDCVTECVVGAIEPSLQRAEIARANSKPTESLDAYDLYLRAMAKWHAGTKEGSVAAEEYLLKAITLDPAYVLAKAQLSMILMSRDMNGWGTADDAMRGISLAREVAAAAPNDAVALCSAGNAISHLAQDYDQARTLLDRAVLLDPNSARVLNSAGWVCLHRLDPEAAIGFFQRAIHISPLDPAMPFLLWGIGNAHILAGRNDEGLAILQRAAQEKPNLTAVYRMIILSLVRLGRFEEAKVAARRVLQIDPDYRLATLNIPFRGEAFKAEYCAALRLAGLPE